MVSKVTITSNLGFFLLRIHKNKILDVPQPQQPTTIKEHSEKIPYKMHLMAWSTNAEDAKTLVDIPFPVNNIINDHLALKVIDDYAKDGGPEVVCIYVAFTKILCSHNFCVWQVTKLKFTGQLQITSLSLYSQFEINLISNRKVIELF